MFDSSRVFATPPRLPLPCQPSRPAPGRAAGLPAALACINRLDTPATGVASGPPRSRRLRRAWLAGLVALLGGTASAAQLTLRWDDNSSNESGFRIERSVNGANFTQLATVGANVTQYVDGAVAASTTYSYRVCAYNATSTSAYSNLASITTAADAIVTPPTTTNNGRLSLVSARAPAGQRSMKTVNLDFTIAGGTKSLLLRGIGPGLSTFTSAKTLADPFLGVYDGSVRIAANDNWGGTPALWAVSNQVGAFPLKGYSKDAALVSTFSSKSYSAVVSGSSDGLAQAEIFDADTAPTARLTKVHASAQVGTGGNALIVGLVVSGNSNARLLLRAIGPSLTGVSGVLQDPQLTLHRGATLLQKNDNWGGGSALSAAFKLAGASSLATSSKDAAIDVTLAPGVYTATVSGVNNQTGVARVEIYEIR